MRSQTAPLLHDSCGESWCHCFLPLRLPYATAACDLHACLPNFTG